METFNKIFIDYYYEFGYNFEIQVKSNKGLIYFLNFSELFKKYKLDNDFFDNYENYFKNIKDYVFSYEMEKYGVDIIIFKIKIEKKAEKTKVKKYMLRNITDKDLYEYRDGTHIHLSHCVNMTGDGFKYLTNLDSISLWYCENIKPESFRYLANVRYICHNNITDDMLYYLKNVRELKLYNCHRFTHEGLKYLENVESIDLSYSGVTDKGLMNLQNVKEISLWDCRNITDGGLYYLKNAEEVDISSTKISYLGLKYLKNVRELNISYCENVNGSSFKYLKNINSIIIKDNNIIKYNYRYLKDVSEIIIINSNITDKELGYFSNANKIILKFCYNITDEGVRKLLGDDKYIDIFNCRNVSSNLLDEIKQRKKID